MQYTENLQLAKYETNDVTSYLEVANANMTKIDAGHGALNAQVTANTNAIGEVQDDVDALSPQIAESTTKANAGLSNTASVYDATQTYAVGDYVLYNNNLYRCITAVTQAESFDGTKWVRAKTTDEIKACNDRITQVDTNLLGRITTIERDMGGYKHKFIERTVTIPTSGVEFNIDLSADFSGETISRLIVQGGEFGVYLLPYIYRGANNSTSFVNPVRFNANTKTITMAYSEDWRGTSNTLTLDILYK